MSDEFDDVKDEGEELEGDLPEDDDMLEPDLDDSIEDEYEDGE